MELTLREFENLNLYSHKNMEKVIKTLVNESSNAALTNMYDDSLILLDHTEGKFYSADYQFNESNLVLTIDNFEEISLVKEDSDFNESVEQFFEDEEDASSELLSSYKKNILEQEKFIDDLVNETVSSKDFSNSIDYKEIISIKEDVDITKERYFPIYEERIISHPLTNIKYFNWVTPVVVSLTETEEKRFINVSSIEKAKGLWKDQDFKEEFFKAVEVIDEDTDYLTSLFENYPVILYMSEDDRLSLLGKTLLTSDYRAERKKIISLIEEFLKSNKEIIELKEEYMIEDSEEVTKEDAKLELTAEERQELVNKFEDLSKLAENSKKGLEEIVEKLKDIVEKGTNPVVVKEALSILAL